MGGRWRHDVARSGGGYRAVRRCGGAAVRRCGSALWWCRVDLQIERLDEARVLQHNAVPHTPHIDPIRVGPHTQLWMLSHALLDDLGDVLQSGPELFEFVVAEGHVAGEVGLVA